MSFILYDIPSKFGRGISPGCWTIRYILIHRQLPFSTQWTEYPDIEPLYKDNHIAPTSYNPDGTPRYTLPVLYDSDAQIYISDSFEIAKYIEKNYPSSNRTVFPSNTVNLHAVFNDAFIATLIPNFPFLFVITHSGLNPPSAAFYRHSREKILGKTLEEVVATSEDEKVLMEGLKDAFGKMDNWYSQKNANREQGPEPFIMGNTPCWTDFAVVGLLAGLRSAWGEQSPRWKSGVMLWHGRRWETLINSIESRY